MTVEKNELRAIVVQAGVNITRRADGGEIFAVKQPDNNNWSRWNSGEFDVRVVSGSLTIKPLIQTVMEKIILQRAGIAPPRI